MANTTSGTTTFEKTFYIDKIIEEAYERIGLSAPRTGQRFRVYKKISKYHVPGMGKQRSSLLGSSK
jgi:hypothetical protein